LYYRPRLYWLAVSAQMRALGSTSLWRM